MVSNTTGGEADIFLSLFDLTGQRKWTKIIGTDKEEYIKHILIDPISGDIIIAGNERTSEGNRGFISKISNEGEELWKQQSSGNQVSVFDQIATQGEKFYVVGNKVDNSGGSNGLIIKYNSQGEQEWEKSLAKGTSMGGVTIDVLGNIYVTGGSQVNLNGELNNAYISDSFISKYDNSGEHLWTKFVGEETRAKGKNILSLNNAIYVSGFTSVGGNEWAFIAKYSLDGALDWKKKFIQESTYETPRLAPAKNGDGVYYIDGSDLVTVTSNGIIERIKTVGSLADANYLTSITTKGDSIMVVGASGSNGYLGRLEINLGEVVPAPLVSSTSGIFREGVTLTAPLVTGDPDGDALNPNYSHQWFKGSTAISGATASTYVVPVTGAGTYKVSITYTDAQEFTTTVETPDQFVSTFNNGNGTPGVITSSSAGVFQEGVTITAPLVTGDPDGDASNPNYAYQWYKGGNIVAGATASTYTVPVKGADTYKVNITYTDAQNFRVTIDSPDQVIAGTRIPTYTITTPLPINEGAVLTTRVATTNVKSGTTLYYSLSGTRIDADDFSKGTLLGSAKVASNGSLTFSHTIKSDLKTEGDETLAIKLFSDSARTKQVGSTASVVIRDTSTAPVFRDIGTLAVRAGTRGVDRITGQGGEIVYGGDNNDILTGFSKISDNGEWIIPSFLSGGLANDQYNVTQGAFVVVMDAGGGIDTVSAPSMNINNIEFFRVNQRDIYATDGNTIVLLVDPQGIQGSQYKLENFVIGTNRFSLAQLTKIANQSDYLGGDYTYTQLQSLGWLNLAEVGMDPLKINAYMTDASYNNSIVV